MPARMLAAREQAALVARLAQLLDLLGVRREHLGRRLGRRRQEDALARDHRRRAAPVGHGRLPDHVRLGPPGRGQPRGGAHAVAARAAPLGPIRVERGRGGDRQDGEQRGEARRRRDLHRWLRTDPIARGRTPLLDEARLLAMALLPTLACLVLASAGQEQVTTAFVHVTVVPHGPGRRARAPRPHRRRLGWTDRRRRPERRGPGAGGGRGDRRQRSLADAGPGRHARAHLGRHGADALRGERRHHRAQHVRGSAAPHVAPRDRRRRALWPDDLDRRADRRRLAPGLAGKPRDPDAGRRARRRARAGRGGLRLRQGLPERAARGVRGPGRGRRGSRLAGRRPRPIGGGPAAGPGSRSAHDRALDRLRDLARAGRLAVCRRHRPVRAPASLGAHRPRASSGGGRGDGGGRRLELPHAGRHAEMARSRRGRARARAARAALHRALPDRDVEEHGSRHDRGRDRGRPGRGRRAPRARRGAAPRRGAHPARHRRGQPVGPRGLLGPRGARQPGRGRALAP